MKLRLEDIHSSASGEVLLSLLLPVYHSPPDSDYPDLDTLKETPPDVRKKIALSNFDNAPDKLKYISQATTITHELDHFFLLFSTNVGFEICA